jgi:Asp-tRNA(Asn)/Glu-tRNA(Gln) amidotransferase B subunit
MKQVNSLLQNLSLRKILTVFLVGFTVFVIRAVGFSNASPALAEAVTPEATSYQVERVETKNIKSDNGLIEKVKEAADNVREKLNLDEPIDPGTKDFLNSTQERVEDAVKPITGKEKGSFQDN